MGGGGSKEADEQVAQFQKQVADLNAKLAAKDSEIKKLKEDNAKQDQKPEPEPETKTNNKNEEVEKLKKKQNELEAALKKRDGELKDAQDKSKKEEKLRKKVGN
eukprot:Rmarinus@m.4783